MLSTSGNSINSQQQQQSGRADLDSSSSSSETTRSERFYGSSDEVKFTVPLPNALLQYPMVSKVWSAMIPKFPDSIKDRIHISTLVFRAKQEPIHSPFIDASMESIKMASSVHNNTNNNVQVISEGDYERYNNLISQRRIRIIILVAILMQACMSALNYIKYGNYMFRRDVIMTSQLVVTVISAAILFRFPLTSSRVTVLYLQFILLCNPLQRLVWADTFPPYEPSYQIMLWINFSVPTAKFWRASVTGLVGIMSVIIIRILQQYDTVFRILWLQLGTYLLYHIVVGFGSRLSEVVNRALYVELLYLSPLQPAHKTYACVERYCRARSHWLTQRFKDAEIEKRFLAFYGQESFVEVGLLLSTVISSAYYIFQDMYYSKSGMLVMFLVLRFVLVIPGFVMLFYLSIMRKTNPIKADLLSLIIFTLIILAQYAMFDQVVSWEGSLFYFGAMMRVLTLASNQLFLVHTLYIIPISYAIIPLSVVLYGSQNNNYIFFFVVLTVVVIVFTLIREKNQRLRFLVQQYGAEALVDKVAMANKTSIHVQMEMDGADIQLVVSNSNDNGDGDAVGIELSNMERDRPRSHHHHLHSIAIDHIVSNNNDQSTANDEGSTTTNIQGLGVVSPAKSPRRNLLDYSQDSFNVSQQQ
ncbi:hypothetical protein SAMD00019534_110070 [Acytostelium subglobosum LB1]|uniref:hypothetical protein n=1 Tax=Acytostelium subglobosum LB1 TaxID=1410327 RepID=UPI000644FE43|nr:hypothetical protein SAMD00019534_110070 [Acytostelium subglobosum LB1]GAM27831.1 hypothetical protein SAMD00019534_110070 [Acytostelium subglobosum LB1]|eukprot:XP_012749114.1 hypothetical protein SAMD00019534_110070 [Acytostelium subglobosum LB1]